MEHNAKSRSYLRPPVVERNLVCIMRSKVQFFERRQGQSFPTRAFNSLQWCWVCVLMLICCAGTHGCVVGRSAPPDVVKSPSEDTGPNATAASNEPHPYCEILDEKGACQGKLILKCEEGRLVQIDCTVLDFDQCGMKQGHAVCVNSSGSTSGGTSGNTACVRELQKKCESAVGAAYSEKCAAAGGSSGYCDCLGSDSFGVGNPCKAQFAFDVANCVIKAQAKGACR